MTAQKDIRNVHHWRHGKVTAMGDQKHLCYMMHTSTTGPPHNSNT